MAMSALPHFEHLMVGLGIVMCTALLLSLLFRLGAPSHVAEQEHEACAEQVEPHLLRHDRPPFRLALRRLSGTSECLLCFLVRAREPTQEEAMLC